MDTDRRSEVPPTITTVAAGTGPFAAARTRDGLSATSAGATGGMLSGAAAGWLCYTEMPDDGDGD